MPLTFIIYIFAVLTKYRSAFLQGLGHFRVASKLLELWVQTHRRTPIRTKEDMKVFDFLRAYIGSMCAIFASLCSIVSLILMFVGNQTAGLIALTVLCLGFAILICGILRGINKVILDNSDEDYRRISSFCIFQSHDGVKSTFESFRMIQCKRLFLTHIPYKFKWTGSILPKLSSTSQTIEDIVHYDDERKWDEAKIKFQHPLKYNESTVIHIKTENDDPDHKAQPWISCRLDSPIDMMTFRVLLSYKNSAFNQPAILEYKELDAQIDGDYKPLESVPFDKGNKMYSYCCANPIHGRIYRLRWEK